MEVIGYDSEWAIGPAAQNRAQQNSRQAKKRGPDVITLCLPDGKCYLFELRLYNHKVPVALKKLIEDERIKKVANRISSDKQKLREIQCEMRGTIELGLLAKQRGVVAVANSSLDAIVNKLFSCQIEKDPMIRLSDWDLELSQKQKKYAVIDAYAHMFSYMKILNMPFVDPNKVPAPNRSELNQGVPVLLYTSNKSATVASGVVLGDNVVETPFGVARSGTHVKIRLTEGDVQQGSAIVPKGAGNRSFHDLFRETSNDFIEVAWPIARLRTKPEEVEPHEEVTVVTETKMVAPESIDNSDDEEAAGPLVQNAAVTLNADQAAEDDSHLEMNHKGIKQDIEHIFLRFGRVLSKEHGAFRAFMARLSDAFFVPSQADIQLVKTALRKCGLSEEQIKEKPWQYFKRRVRRAVPSPKVLLRDFKKIVNLFADITDGKTGQPLFGKNGWSLFRATVRHIQKGCLSDVPGEAYYVQIGIDSLGIPLFKCIRGTSALEGFHQKIRQLIRGFNISPRLAIASLFEFIHRWNHDIDVRILGLPVKYKHFYDGWELEEDIAITSEWKEMDEIAHPHWHSTNDFASTGETFGLNKAGLVADGETPTEDVEDVTEDPQLEAEIAQIVDAIRDGTLEDSNDDTAEDVLCSSQVLSESAKWVGAQLGRSRTFGNVRTKTEEDFFRDNFHRFQNSQGNQGNEADNYSSIAFGAMANFWDEIIAEEEAGKRPKSDMTLKTAFHLQAYWKKFRRECNTAATMLPIHEANTAMRREFRRESRREHEVTIEPAEMAQNRVLVQTPINAEDEENDVAMALDDDSVNMMVDSEGDNATTDQAISLVRVAAATSESVVEIKNKPKRGRRCKKCGHEYRQGSVFSEYHVGLGKIGKGQLKPHEVCTVPEHERAEGFPLQEGKSIRRRSRSAKQVNK